MNVTSFQSFSLKATRNSNEHDWKNTWVFQSILNFESLHQSRNPNNAVIYTDSPKERRKEGRNPWLLIKQNGSSFKIPILWETEQKEAGWHHRQFVEYLQSLFLSWDPFGDGKKADTYFSGRISSTQPRKCPRRWNLSTGKSRGTTHRRKVPQVHTSQRIPFTFMRKRHCSHSYQCNFVLQKWLKAFKRKTSKFHCLSKNVKKHSFITVFL